MKKRFLAKAVASASLAMCALVAAASPALAQVITRGECTAGGGTLVDHGAWTGCAGISPHHIKVID